MDGCSGNNMGFVSGAKFVANSPERLINFRCLRAWRDHGSGMIEVSRVIFSR